MVTKGGNPAGMIFVEVIVDRDNVEGLLSIRFLTAPFKSRAESRMQSVIGSIKGHYVLACGMCTRCLPVEKKHVG